MKFLAPKKLIKNQFGLPVNPEPAALLAGKEDHRGGISHLEIIQVGAASFFLLLVPCSYNVPCIQKSIL